MKYFLVTMTLIFVFIWFFNEYLGWGFAGSLVGGGAGAGVVIGYLDDKVKGLKKQVEELSNRQ